MKNRFLVFAFLLISAVAAQAQNLPANLWSSPQSTTTEGRYRSNADNFIRPDQYTGLNLNKWFGMVSFLWDNDFGAVATAGFSAKAGSAYIGAFYSGNFWASKPANNYTEQELDPIGGVAGRTYDVYNNINVGGASNPVNNFAVLIGAANMGFRLTYRTNYQSFKENDIVTGGRLYDSYRMQSGYLSPQIAWAMAKDLTAKNGVRPYFTVDLVFDRDYQKVKTAGPDGSNNTGEQVVRSANHIDPAFSFGLGGVHFFNKNNFRLTADLDYVFSMSIYNNEYNYVENGEYKTGKMKGTNSPGSNPYIERSSFSNLVTPSLAGQWSSERIALRFKFNLPLTFSNLEQNTMRLAVTNKLVLHGASDSSFSFIFRPDLRLAMQFQIIPGKLILNTGARLQATAITLETTDRKEYTGGVEVVGGRQKIHQNSYGSGFVSRFHIGTVFNFTENVWVDAATGISNAYGNSGTIEVFAPGGLFAFGSILVGLKF